jgi:hypothetical protein
MTEEKPMEALPLSLDAAAAALMGFGHPIRIRALILLETEHSPTALCGLLDSVPLGVIAYHVRMLKQYGLVRETRTQAKRGALEHFYLRTDLADVLLDTLGPLFGLPPRRRGKRGPKRAADLLAAVAS